jgi:hypothetical protein
MCHTAGKALADAGLRCQLQDCRPQRQRRFRPEKIAEFETPLNGVDDRQQMSQLLDLASDCATLDEFRHAVSVLTMHSS